MIRRSRVATPRVFAGRGYRDEVGRRAKLVLMATVGVATLIAASGSILAISAQAHPDGQRVHRGVAGDPDAGSKRIGHFEYVVTDHEIDVYDIDHANRQVQKLDVRQIEAPRGVVGRSSNESPVRLLRWPG